LAGGARAALLLLLLLLLRPLLIKMVSGFNSVTFFLVSLSLSLCLPARLGSPADQEQRARRPFSSEFHGDTN